jgi:polar amino acid transport system substrate-binding protein
VHRRLAAFGVVASLIALTACGSSASKVSTKAATSGPLGAACAPAQLKTLKSGVLTLGADDPVYPPWYADNNPTNGRGFEDAVAYAVATELGYAHADVHWTRVTFNNAIQPGPKSFDYDLDEFSIDATRARVVDFSTPYYTVHEAIVGLTGSPTAKAHTLAAVRKLQLGAQVGSTDYTAIVDQIKPSRAARIYNDNSDAAQALEDGQIQGLVVDLPTAFELTTGEVKGSVILGQLPEPTGQPEHFGIVLDKASPLTACVDKAVQAITANGTLARLNHTWLAKLGGAPVLK